MSDSPEFSAQHDSSAFNAERDAVSTNPNALTTPPPATPGAG